MQQFTGLDQRIKNLELISRKVRLSTLTTILSAGSGHLGGSLSSNELMVALYFGGILKYDSSNPDHPCRDRVLVRGHLGPLRYSIFSLLGWIDESELDGYRSLGSRLQGHEMMELMPGVDITPSGMLGMSLSFSTGAAKALLEQNIAANVWSLLGDGEEQEGNIGEAARHASNLNLGNLICVLDKNKKQLSQPTKDVDGASDVVKIWQGYGWNVKEIFDGHSFKEILTVFNEPRPSDRPTLIITHTVKGNGLFEAEDKISGYHTLSACPKDYVRQAIEVEKKFLANISQQDFQKIIFDQLKETEKPADLKNSIQSFNFDLTVEPTRDIEEGLLGYLNKLCSSFKSTPDSRLYIMTGDVTTRDLARACGFYEPHVRYIDTGIREQHLLGMAHGISVTDPNSRIVIVEGDPFIFRAADQINAISQAKSKMIIIGADSGICEARNGSTHQTASQPGAFLNMSGLTMLEPADTIDLTSCLNWALTDYSGPIYLRLHSAIADVISVVEYRRNIFAYTAYEPKSKPELVIVASGLTVDPAIKVAQRLEITGHDIKVINVVNPKELNDSFIGLFEDDVPVLTIYNGNPHVLQSAVTVALMEYCSPRPSIVLGHGFTIGTSGTFEDVSKYFQFDADGIEKVIRERFPFLF